MKYDAPLSNSIKREFASFSGSPEDVSMDTLLFAKIDILLSSKTNSIFCKYL